MTARNKPISGTVGTVFGGLWAYLAAFASAPGWRLPLSLLAGVVTLLLVARLWRSRAPESDADERLFGRRSYLVAVMLAVVVIQVASVLLPRLGLQAYFVQAVGIIVGLHFIGLWHATGSARFIRIAVGMCVVSGAAIMLPAAWRSVDVRDVATGLCNALILWIGAGELQRQGHKVGRTSG